MDYSIMDFELRNITELQGFLEERGVTYSKTKKHELVDLCRLAVENNIEVDPNFFKDSIIDELKSKLKYCGRTIPDPKLLNSGTTDLSGIPSLNNFDIYDYLKHSDVYPSSQLRDFKNLKGYRLYENKYVESINVSYNVAGNGVHVVKSGSENAAGGAGGAGMQLQSLHAAIPLSQSFLFNFLPFLFWLIVI